MRKHAKQEIVSLREQLQAIQGMPII